MPASIKTVLQLDDTPLKAKLDQVKKYYNQTYNDWANATEKVTIKDKELAQQKEKLAIATANLAKEKQNSNNLDKQVVSNIEKEIAGRKSKIKVLTEEKRALAASASQQKAELSMIGYGEGILKKKLDTTNQTISATKDNTTATKNQTKSTESLANATIRYLRWAGTIAGVVYAGKRAWDSTLGTGLQVSKMMEDNQSGIAALLSANTQMVTSNGTLVNSYQKFQMGQGVATKSMEELRVASIKTYATFPQLTEIFQQAIGHTMSMGDSFGTTTESIITNTVELAKRMSNIAGSIGMPMDRAKEEIRSIVSANASTDSLIATMLFGSPGEANKAIKEAKTKGANGVKDMLDAMLEPFDALEGVTSFTRATLELQDAWSQTMMKLIKDSGVFNDLKVTFYDLAKTITANQKEITDGFDFFYENSKKVVSVLDDVAIAVAAYYGAKGVIGAYGKASEALGTLISFSSAYDEATKKNITSVSTLTTNIKALALANPFTAWTIGIATVIAGVYELQRISEKLSGERFTAGIKGSISSTSGKLAGDSAKEDVDKALKSYEAQVTARAKILASADKESELYRRSLEAVASINDEMIRLGKIQDGTLLKQEALAKSAEAWGNLLTKIPLNAELYEKITKENNKANEETLNIQKEIDEVIKEQVQYGKLYNAIQGQGAKEDKQRGEALKRVEASQLFIANKQKEIAEIRTKEYEKQEALRREHSKILQDEWVASQKLSGIDIKKSDMLLLELSATSKLLEKEHDKYEIAKLNTKVLEDAFSLHKTLAEEESKRLDIQDKLFIAAQKRNGIELEGSTIMAMELTRLYERLEVETDINENQLLQADIDNKIYETTKQVGEEKDKERQREEKYLKEKANLNAQLIVEQEKLNSLSVIYSSKRDDITSSYVKQLADIDKQVAKINDQEILEEEKLDLLADQKKIRDTILAQQAQELDNASIFRQTMIETVDIMQDGFQDFFDFSKDGFLDLSKLAKGLGNDILGSFSKNMSSGISTSLMGSIFGAQKAEASLGSLGLTLSNGTYKGVIDGQNVEVDTAGNILSGGGLSSVVNAASGLKSASSLFSGGLSGVLYAPSAGIGGLAGSASAAGYTGIADFLGGSATALGGGSAAGTSLTGTAQLGSVSTLALGGAAIGYGVGSLGDKLFGADTKAGAGGAIGGALGTFLAPGIGTAIGSALGSAIGGLFGSTKLKDSGIYAGAETSASSGIDELSRYEDYKKKSWFSSKSWTTFTDLTDSEKSKIENIFESYDYLLAQLGDFNNVVVEAGKYTGETFQDEIAKSLVSSFTGISQVMHEEVYKQVLTYSEEYGAVLEDTTEKITQVSNNPVFDEIYKAWEAYAEEVNRTTGQVITDALSGLVQTERGFTEWALGLTDGIDALSYKAEYLAKDFENLAKMMDAENVTVDNYTESMRAALQENLTPENIDLWTQLGNSLMASTNATKAYTDALIQEENLKLQAALNSANNIGLFLDSFKSQEQLTRELASAIGVDVAENTEELASMFKQLAYDADGLTDAELKLLNMNKDLIISLNQIEIDDFNNQINSLDETLNSVSSSISSLENAFDSINNTVEKLRGGALGSTYTLDLFYKSMKETQDLSKGSDYQAYIDSLNKTIGYTSALSDTSSFQTSRDMQFAQLVAANQFQELGVQTVEQIDYLRLIEVNTREQINAILLVVEALGAQVNKALFPYQDTVSSAYQNVLGREADVAGSDYWQGQLASGAVSASGLSGAIANAAVSYSGGAVAGVDINASKQNAADYLVKDIYSKYDLDQYQTDNSGYEYWQNQVLSGAIAPENLNEAIRTSAESALGTSLIPQFASGTPNVPYDMLAQIHKGEMIPTATMSEGIRNGDVMLGDTSGIVERMDKLITRIEALEKTNSEYLARIEYNTTKSRTEGVA